MSHVTYTPGRSTLLAVTDVSGRAPLAGSGTVVRVLNAGAAVAYVAVGDAAVAAAVPGGTATANSTPVLAGEVAYFSVSFTEGYVAAICASGQTTTVLVTRGEGRGTEGVSGSVSAYAAEAWMASQGWAGASLAADFVNQRYAIRAANTGVAQYAPLSAFTFSRASTATYVDSAGIYRTASNNVLRFTYDPATLVAQGALLETSTTNYIRNNAMVGAMAGNPGTMPTNWTRGSGIGLTHEVIGVGVEGGIDYIDLRISGTPTATLGIPVAQFDAYTATPAAAGQNWTTSTFCALRGGSLSGISSTFVLARECSSAGAILMTRSSAFVPTDAALIDQRRVLSFTTTDANTAYLYASCGIGVTTGVPIDITLRIGWPQLERSVNVSSPIRTTSAALARAADSLSISVAGLLSASAGTMYASGSTLTGNLQGVNGLLQVDDATIQNRVSLYQVSTANRQMALYIASGGIASANAAFGTAVTAGALVRTAVAWGGGSAGASVNGGAATAYGSVVSPSVSRLLVGGGGVGGNLWGSTVQSAVLFPTKLSDAQVQGLTQ